MNLSHHRPPTRPARPGWSRPDAGYSMVMVALLLVPMMIFAGLAVDVGSWYTRAAEIQRAADAAALAGVVWMPDDFDRARTEARNIAARNGFEHDPSGTGITVTVAQVPGRPHELDVIVTDPHVPTFLGAVVKDEISITRSARGRFTLPVAMGSPLNTFANQNVPPTSSDPKLWAAIMAPYTNRGQGDAYATSCINSSSNTSCSTTNPWFRGDGYTYIVNVPESAVGKTLTVSVFDGSFTDRGLGTETGDDDYGRGGTRSPYLYELYDTDFTPLDHTDNPSMVGSSKCTGGTSGRRLYASTGTYTKNIWESICQFTVTQAGLYPLRVSSWNVPGQTNRGYATNQYALRAVLSSNPQPQLYAYTDMSIMTNLGGTSANMYLAEVTPSHAGKTFRVSLFDAGDGSGVFDLSLVQPNGTIPSCRWNNPGSSTLSQSGPCTIRTNNGGSGGARYEGQWLFIEIDLPTSYTCTQSGSTPSNPGLGTVTACWFRLRYAFSSGSSPTDRTTWKAEIIGDPVQLVR